MQEQCESLSHQALKHWPTYIPVVRKPIITVHVHVCTDCTEDQWYPIFTDLFENKAIHCEDKETGHVSQPNSKSTSLTCHPNSSQPVHR